MVRVLAREVAPLGITCNVVAPSIVDTEAVEAMGEAVQKRALEALTIKRKLTVPEICHVVEFLAAPESASITGQTIYMGLVV
jgi:3-oxoacyl-[acyl-carrier protein] reductase